MREWEWEDGHPRPVHLSAYQENKLPPAEHSRVEEHLGQCAACREKLARRIWLEETVRLSPAGEAGATTVGQPLPSLSPPLRRFRLGRQQPALAALILVLVLGAALLFLFRDSVFSGRFFGGDAEDTIVPPTAAGAERTPLAASSVPTVAPASAASSPTVQAASGEAMPTVAAYPAPADTATPALDAAEAPTATIACEIQPVRGFGLLYRSQPDLASSLGCPKEPEAGVRIVQQPFERGLLLWVEDRFEIYALLPSGKWRLYLDTYGTTRDAAPAAGGLVASFSKLLAAEPALATELGQPLAAQTEVSGAVEKFQGGSLIWTEDRLIRALRADGTWQAFEDRFYDATPTPESAATVPPLASPKPAATPAAHYATATPAVTPTASEGATEPASPVASGCTVEPVRGFGLVYHSNPAVAAKLGCALGTEFGLPVSRQTFERGVMIQRSDTREILIIKQDGTWSLHLDNWRAGEALLDAGTPPAGLSVPDGPFGKVWREAAGVKEALGWATGPAESLPGAIQEFAAGRLLWTSDRIIYALYPDGTSQSFADRFVD